MTSGQHLSKITGTCRASQSCRRCRTLVAQGDRSTQETGEVLVNQRAALDVALASKSKAARGEPVGLPPVVEGLLVDIVADGFVLYCCGHRVKPNALVASYQWENCLDLVTIRNFDRVSAARVPTPNRGHVDVFAPEVVVWAREGPPQWTLQAMLNLVHPAHPEAPSAISPAPRSLHIPHGERRPLTIRPPSPVRAGVRAARLAREALTMAKHDQTRDGGRPQDQVDPSKIVRPRDEDDGKHSGDSSRDDQDDK